MADKKTVLVADDMEDVIENIQLILGEDEYNYLNANSGEEAMKILMANDVDLVITDIAMPGGNGLELIKSMKKLASPPKIVLVTGYASMFPEDEEAKADAVIEKPWDNNDLIQTVKGLLIS